MSNGTKPEMTAEEFIYKNCGTFAADGTWIVFDKEEKLSDLRSVIRGELIKFVLHYSDGGYPVTPKQAEDMANEFLGNNQ